MTDHSAGVCEHASEQQQQSVAEQTEKQLVEEIRIRRQAETALRSSEERLSSVVTNISESVLLVSEEHTVLFANQPPPYSGIRDVTGRECRELWPFEAAQELQDALTQAETLATQRCITIKRETADSDDCVVELTVRPITDNESNKEFVLIFRDITAERKQHRERQRAGTAKAHQSRLNALGEMASNISHEITQPLTAVANLSSAARRVMRKEHYSAQVVKEMLGEIVDEAQRAGDIVHRLREFARRSPVERKKLTLKDCVESALSLTSNELSVCRVGVTTTVPDDICIYADAIHIQQILVNLLLNAVQALEAAQCGRRNISIAAFAMDSTVTLTVRDTGPGFGDTSSGNPLEAYVTTKPQGTGIGLSICLSLVELNGGTLTIGDSPEGGAVITMHLPAPRPKESPRDSLLKI